MYMWRERSKEEKHEDVVNTGLLPLDVVEDLRYVRAFSECTERAWHRTE